MLKLINQTGTTSKIGYAVVQNPNDSNGFIYASPNSTRVLGVVSQSVPYRAKCDIATQGEKTQIYVQGNVVKDSIIRLSKSTDRVSLGASTVAKTGDSPYLKIGSALNGGKGLIPVILDLNYISGAESGDHVEDGTYTIGLGAETDGTIEVKNGVIISITEAT